MAIEMEQVQKIGGLPVFAWRESRGFLGMCTERIVCFATPHPDTRILQFASAGNRYGAFLQMRDWSALKSFTIDSAQIYDDEIVSVAKQWIVGRRQSLGGFFPQAGGVVLATFTDNVAKPMHLNNAQSAPVEMHELHEALMRVFVTERSTWVDVATGGDWEWPEGKPLPPLPVPPHAPRKARGVLLNALLAVLIVGLLAYLVYLGALISGFVRP